MNGMKRFFYMIIGLTLIITFSFFTLISVYAANPQSTTYELKSWGFGSGGVATTSSTTYSMSGTAGEIDNASTESNTYRINAGLVFTMQVNVPPAPSFTNPGNNYDRLRIIVNTGNNPADAQYAIAISKDNWQTTQYIQNDYTAGSGITWLPYSGSISWNGTSGFYVTGLTNSTTYSIKVKARQGYMTETGWGPSISTSTVDPSLTFGIDSATITFTNLNSGNNFTDSSKSTVLTTSTNAYNGYIVYGNDASPLNTTYIPNYASPNSAPTSWTGTGFGYTTNDSNLTGGTANRFTSGGPNYAGFTTSSPGDPVADHAGPVTTPISSEQFTISYRVTANTQTPAGTYGTTVSYIVVPSY